MNKADNQDQWCRNSASAISRSVSTNEAAPVTHLRNKLEKQRQSTPAVTEQYSSLLKIALKVTNLSRACVWFPFVMQMVEYKSYD